MLDALATPGVHGMELSVLSLDDAGIGVLAHGALLESYHVIPVEAIVRDSYTQRIAHTLGGAVEGSEIIIYKHVTAIGKSHGIGAGIIVGHIHECHGGPGRTIVGTPARGEFGVTCTANDLQATIGKLKYARLNGIYRFELLLLICTVSRIGGESTGGMPCLTAVIAHLDPCTPSFTLTAAGGYDAAIDILGLVLDRAKDPFGKRFAVRPGDTTVGRASYPSGPVSHAGAYLEEQHDLVLAGNTEQYRVPASLATCVGDVTFEMGTYGTGRCRGGLGIDTRESCKLDGGIVEIKHTVGSNHGFGPLGSTLGLTAHPYHTIGVLLLGTSEEGSNKVAVGQFHDSGAVALGE